MSERVDVATHVATVAVVLAAAVYGLATDVRPSAPAVGTPAPEPTPSLPLPTVASSGAVASPSARPSTQPSAAAPTASAAASPSASRQPISTAAYAFNGHSYTGVSLGTGWTITAPFDGHVEVHVYQLVDGTIREFANAAAVPSYPYVIVTAADGRKMTYRPGAVDTDTRVLVAASQTVKAGADLFTVIGTGPSSWHDFYDQSVTFQIVVSLVTAAGADADAAPLIQAH